MMGAWANMMRASGIDFDQLLAQAAGQSPGFGLEDIGRIVVAPGNRTEGLGKDIVLFAEKAISQHYGAGPVKLSAQSYLKKFYSDLGYQSIGEEYLEDGIPHIAMIKTP